MIRLRKTIGLLLAAPLIMSGVSCSGGGSGGGSGEGPDGREILATLELEAAYPEPFSFLSRVRPLPDGRFLAADPLSQVLLRVDMDAGTADTLGGIGGGPEEYQQPDEVFALPGDSTLLVDLGKTYLTIIGPDGEFHDGMSMALPTADGAPSIVIPEFVDGQGRIYYQGMGGLGGPADSMGISRYDRESASSEVVGMLWRTEPIVTRSGENVSMTRPRMAPDDDWAVGSDGRVAIVRANGYQIEWHLPDGTVVTGPETPFEEIGITYEDKEADLEEYTGAGLSIAIMRTASGDTNMQMSRGGMRGGGEEPSVEDETWGETFPPFRVRASHVSPANELWVLRWLPRDREPMMDVFGPDGELLGAVLIPRDTRLVSFGEGPGGENTVFTVRTDEFGLQWLERYRVVRN